MKPLVSRLRRMIIPDGSVQRVWFGPYRGLRFRAFTGLGLKFKIGYRDTEEVDICIKSIRPGHQVYDVGSNAGQYAMLFSRLVGGKGSVMAFEPDPEMARKLRENLSLNRIVNVEVVESAVGSRSGTAQFDSTGGGTGHLSAAGSVAVSMLTLDQLGRDPDFIKIDVEGHESDVLEGARETIARKRPPLLIELHNPEQDREVGRILMDLNYSAYRLSGEAVKNMREGWPHPDGMWGTVRAVASERR